VGILLGLYFRFLWIIYGLLGGTFSYILYYFVGARLEIFGDGIVAYWAGTGVLDCALVRMILVKVGN